MIIKQFDTVFLKDGRTAAVMETFENKAFLVDVGNSPEDWDTISITIEKKVPVPGKQKIYRVELFQD